MFVEELLRSLIWVLIAGGFASIAIIIWPWFDFAHQTKTIVSWVVKQKYIITRIYPPAENEQSIAEMHAFFKAMTTSYLPKDPINNYIDGSWHEKYSFEIHSINGKVGLYILINEKRLDLLRNNLLSRFPGARIEIVEDPLKDYPKKWNFKNLKQEGNNFRGYTTFFGAELDKLGNEKILNPEAGNHEGNDIFPLKSYLDFQKDENNPIADPMIELFSILKNIQNAHIVIQFIATPYGTNDVKVDGGNLKADWQKQFKLIKQHYINDSTGESVVASDSEESESGAKAMLLTQSERDSLDAINRAIDDQIWKLNIMLSIWSDRPNPKNLFQEVFPYFEELSSNGVRFLPRPGIRTWDDDKGKDHGFLGPWIGIIKNQLFWDRQRWYQSNWVYDKVLGRSVGGLNPPKAYTAENLATFYHFPVTTNQEASKLQMARELSEGDSDEGGIAISTTAPTNLPF